MTPTADTNRLLLDAIEWARQAGNIQLEHFRKGNLDIRSKLNDSDIVTVADRASEALIIEQIGKYYPTHAILSEESGTRAGTDTYRWVIDPLDGTTNFSNGLPGFAVSIGIEHGGETIVGVVYAPYLGELFHAVKGEGAFLNGNPIHCSGNSIMARAVISTGFPVDKNVNPDNNLPNMARVLPHVRGLRRLGSAAMDICYVAAGFLDGYWELNLHQWDVCAAMLIAREAGAMHSYFRTDREVSVAVASPGIFPQLMPLLSTEPAK